MLKLWLLRHARAVVPPGLCYGASDVRADEEHTQQVAHAFAQVLPQGVPLWVSGLTRAQQLATALHTLRPDVGIPIVDVRLNEMNFGHWELQPWDAVPRAALDAWVADFAHHRFGDVQSTQQVIDRVAEALTALKTAGVPEALWVTHAGVIRAAQWITAHGHGVIRDANQWPREAPAPGCWVVVYFDF